MSCVRKWAEVPPKSVTVFAKNIVQKDGGGGYSTFESVVRMTLFCFLRCFIGGEKLPFLYISPKYLRCKKILALRQSRNAKFRFRCHFYTELQNATTLSTNGHGLFLVLPVFWRPVTKLQIIGWLNNKVGLPPIMRANNDMTLCMNPESRQFFESTHKLVVRCTPTYNLYKARSGASCERRVESHQLQSWPTWPCPA